MKRIRRISVTVEPWVHARQEPDSLTVEARFKIELEGLEPMHCVEVMRESDFETRFEWFMKNVQDRIKKIMEADEKGTLTFKDNAAFIDGKELGRW